jgi:hypothetical protein
MMDFRSGRLTQFCSGVDTGPKKENSPWQSEMGPDGSIFSGCSGTCKVPSTLLIELLRLEACNVEHDMQHPVEGSGERRAAAWCYAETVGYVIAADRAAFFDCLARSS